MGLDYKKMTETFKKHIESPEGKAHAKAYFERLDNIDKMQDNQLEFLNDETNGAKKANNHRILKEVLDFHNIYEILDNDEYNVIHLTYDYLMQFYLERHHALGIDKCRIKATGEIYDVYAVYYHKDYKKAEITLRIESDCNNKYSFGELEKISK